MAAARGFTLVELLLVLVILGALAAGASSLTRDLELQTRYELTQDRWRAIREATAGQDGRGAGRVCGFVADVGRLPHTLDELLARPPSLPAYAFDPDTGLGFGWRGPYLRSLPAHSGAREFPDGWGSRPGPGDPAGDFGWRVRRVADPPTLWVQSLGRDGRPGDGDSRYDRDYPAATAPLVKRADCFVDLNAWQLVVRLSNPSGPPAQGRLRLRLSYPAGDGSPGHALSEAQRVRLPAGASEARVFRFPREERWIPWGARMLEVVREQPPGSGTFRRAGPGPAQELLLLPRALRPRESPGTWVLR